MYKNFKLFLETEEENNVKRLIKSLPKGHQNLLNGYKFVYTPNNTLKGDNQHIGYIYKNKIVIAAPWNYGRAFTTLHEIAHLVWEYKLDKDLRKEWESLVQKTKQEFIKSLPKKNQDSLKQNAEEIFCMVYANVYSKHALLTYSNPKWEEFLLNKVPN